MRMRIRIRIIINKYVIKLNQISKTSLPNKSKKRKKEGEKREEEETTIITSYLTLLT